MISLFHKNVILYLVAVSRRSLAKNVTHFESLSPMSHSNSPKSSKVWVDSLSQGCP